MGEQNVVEEQVGLVLILGDVGVLIHAEYVGLGVERQRLYVVQVALVVAIGRREVQAALVELVVVVLHDLLAIEALQQRLERASIRALCHTTAVVALA